MVVNVASLRIHQNVPIHVVERGLGQSWSARRRDSGTGFGCETGRIGVLAPKRRVSRAWSLGAPFVAPNLEHVASKLAL